MANITPDNIPAILKRYDIRLTGVRRAVLEILIDADKAMSHANMEEALPSGFDRVTIFRTLNLFNERHLVHKVIDSGGIARYALCDVEKCDLSGHHDNHIHFVCNHCQEIFCIHSSREINISLPDGYRMQEVQITGRGFCPACSEQRCYEAG